MSESNTPLDEGGHTLTTLASKRSCQAMQEALIERFQKQFVLSLRDPHLLEVDLDLDPPASCSDWTPSLTMTSRHRLVARRILFALVFGLKDLRVQR